jgi:hypothetical protein
MKELAAGVRAMRLAAAVAASVALGAVASVVSAAAPSIATPSRRLARDDAAVYRVANGREYDGDGARLLARQT